VRLDGRRRRAAGADRQADAPGGPRLPGRPERRHAGPGAGPDGKGIKTGRLWVSIGDHDHPYVVYTYTPDRSADGPKTIFKDFQGYLQADAYSGYDGLFKSGDIVEVGCMMHARRRFYEARDSDPQRSHQALAWISLLYDVEREAKDRATSDYAAFVALRHELRSERSRPIFDQFRAWLEAELPKVLPKSPIGEAIQYALNHWEALKRPLEAGFLELDNGACERAFKPVGIGRRNWLFAGSDKGGADGGDLDEPVRDLQGPGDRPAGIPPRCARSDQHPSGQADRRVAAGPLAGAGA
jgi:Transposase IS66 family